MKNIFTFLALSLVIVGCSSQKVEYFQYHTETLEERVEKYKKLYAVEAKMLEDAEKICGKGNAEVQWAGGEPYSTDCIDYRKAP